MPPGRWDLVVVGIGGREQGSVSPGATRCHQLLRNYIQNLS